MDVEAGGQHRTSSVTASLSLSLSFFSAVGAASCTTDERSGASSAGSSTVMLLSAPSMGANLDRDEVEASLFRASLLREGMVLISERVGANLLATDPSLHSGRTGYTTPILACRLCKLSTGKKAEWMCMVS